MKKLMALAAATALIPAAAAAQAPHAGHTWTEGPAPQVRVMQHGGGHVRHHQRMRHRFQRGAFVPDMWWGPRFHVRNWRGYGFPQPMHGRRWIRVHDDALLIDGEGRVHDGRYDWDWSRHQSDWRDGPDGVPVYVGDGDFEPDEWDYEWAERWERGEGRDDYGYADDRYGPDGSGLPPELADCGNPCVRTYHGPPPPLPDFSNYCCGPVVITETVVTTRPAYEERVVYEEVEALPAKRVRARRAPPPLPGERG